MNVIMLINLWILLLVIQNIYAASIKTAYAYVNETPPHYYRVIKNQRLRIHPYYSKGLKKLQQFDKLRETAFEPAIKFWENYLIPKKPNVNPILLPRQCDPQETVFVDGRMVCKKSCAKVSHCLDFPIPARFLDACYSAEDSFKVRTNSEMGEGVKNADLLILFRVTTEDSCEKIINASHCVLQTSDDRPIAGIIDICVDETNEYVDIKKHEVMHYIAHILGFNDYLYLHFRDDAGKPRTPRDANGIPKFRMDENFFLPEIGDTIVQKNFSFKHKNKDETRKISFLATPTVKEFMQTYFNCPSAIGAPMEEDSISHFEARIFVNELMTQLKDGTRPIVSPFTWAVMKDTGWYKLSKHPESNFFSGRNNGCDFIYKSCYEYMTINNFTNISPYCSTDKNELSCSSNRDAVTHCNIIMDYAGAIPSEFHYFSNEFMTGADKNTDYCPHFKVRHRCITEPSDRVAQNPFAQEYGKTSRCIEYNGEVTFSHKYLGEIKIKKGAGCYKVVCDETNRYYNISILSENKTCYHDTKSVNITQKIYEKMLIGDLTCPSYKSVCANNEREKIGKNGNSIKIYYGFMFLTTLLMTIFSKLN